MWQRVAVLLVVAATGANAAKAEHKINAYDRHYMAKTKYKVLCRSCATTTDAPLPPPCRARSPT